jgi:transcriptional regulator with XRE-family HTH domain
MPLPAKWQTTGGKMGMPRGIERFGTLSQEEFAARCRAARGYAGLKLDEVGKLMGVSRQALSRRERGWVAIQVPDRYVMAMVYCEITGWPEEVFTQNEWPEMEAPVEAEVEPEELLSVAEEGLDDSAQA